MSVRRTYTSEEVSEIIKTSELMTGHALQRHGTNEASDPFLLTRGDTSEATRWCAFTQQVVATTAALNSPNGQLELQRLDNNQSNSVSIDYDILALGYFMDSHSKQSFKIPFTNIWNIAVDYSSSIPIEYNIPARRVKICARKNPDDTLHIVTSYPIK